MDLFKVLIIGPRKTPYVFYAFRFQFFLFSFCYIFQVSYFLLLLILKFTARYSNSAFAFDMQLPPSYPDVPPYVHYCSLLNERLNPNLYETGKVCCTFFSI